MALSFKDWKAKLVLSAGGICLASAVLQMGDFVLELFWRDGCEPTVSPLLDYSQAGLCRHYAQNAHTDGGPGPGIAALKAPAS